MTSHNVTIDKNWSLTFVRFLVWFFVVVVVFFNLFKCETFFFVNLKSFFTFNIFCFSFVFSFPLTSFHVCFFWGGGHPQGFTKVQVFTTT